MGGKSQAPWTETVSSRGSPANGLCPPSEAITHLVSVFVLLTCMRNSSGQGIMAAIEDCNSPVYDADQTTLLCRPHYMPMVAA